MILVSPSSWKLQFRGLEKSGKKIPPPRTHQTVMALGNGGSTRWPGRGPAIRGGLGVWLCLLAGCALGRPHLDQALMTGQGADPNPGAVAECYLVHCPDVLEVRVAGRPDV